MIFKETSIINSLVYLKNHLKHTFKGYNNIIVCNRLIYIYIYI